VARTLTSGASVVVIALTIADPVVGVSGVPPSGMSTIADTISGVPCNGQCENYKVVQIRCNHISRMNLSGYVGHATIFS